MSAYPHLQQYLNAYLYDGYPEDCGGEWGALAVFVSEQPQYVPALQAEIAALLSQKPTERELAQVIVVDIRANLDVTQAGLTWRGWLTRVSEEAGRLAAHPGAA